MIEGKRVTCDSVSAAGRRRMRYRRMCSLAGAELDIVARIAVWKEVCASARMHMMSGVTLFSLT